jgi:hypothetical protein
MDNKLLELDSFRTKMQEMQEKLKLKDKEAIQILVGGAFQIVALLSLVRSKFWL